MVENIEWFKHSSFRLTGEKIIYIDPRNISDPKPADAVLISHPHSDHFSPDDIKKISKRIKILTAYGAEFQKKDDTMSVSIVKGY